MLFDIDFDVSVDQVTPVTLSLEAIREVEQFIYHEARLLDERRWQAWLDLWTEEGLNSGASVNPPGVMASALNVAVFMLQGRELKEPADDGVYGNALYLDIPFIDSSNVDDVAAEMEGQPGHYSHTDQLSIEEAEELFKDE